MSFERKEKGNMSMFKTPYSQKPANTKPYELIYIHKAYCSVAYTQLNT